MAYQVVWPNVNVGTNPDGSAKVVKRGELLPEEGLLLDISSLVVIGAVQPVEDVPKKEEEEPVKTLSTSKVSTPTKK